MTARVFVRRAAGRRGGAELAAPTCKSAEPLNWQDQRCDFGDQDAEFCEDMAEVTLWGLWVRRPALRR